MHAALRNLRLADGRLLQTPLLVPSFSSRGFGLVDGDPTRSEVSGLLDYFSAHFQAALLVSAYDMHHRLLEAGDVLHDGTPWAHAVLSRPELLIIDSGGYEATPGADAGEIMQDHRLPHDWQESMFANVVDALPEAASNVAVASWDRPGIPYEDQMRAAQEFFGGRTGIASIMLLKPEERGGFHEMRRLEGPASRLAAFSAVGVTEHELGGSLLDRIQAVTSLREVLSRANSAAPIHIFGALDPLYVPLYFAAGADVFDGLTWLRYAYWHGLAIHREQGPLMEGLLETREDVRRYGVLTRNLEQLNQLDTRLRRFVSEDGNWKVFSDISVRSADAGLGEVLRDAYLSAIARRA